MSTKRPYENVWDWMERTGTSQTTLAARTKIKRSMLCQILSGGKRCSLVNALKLMYVTGVCVEKLFDKSKFDPAAQAAKVSRREVA
jgi:plasmid maintenance system antidote protein VapI